MRAVLIIGCGIVGKRHAAVQAKFGKSVGIFDQSLQRAKRLSDEMGYAFFDSLQEAVSWADLIHICTPDHLHTEIALQVISMKKAVLCEKPVTTSLHDGLRIQAAVQRHHTRFIIGNNYRLTASFQAIQNAVKDSGEPIISLETTYLHNMRSYIQKTPWRAGQDFLFGGAVHAIDLAYHLAGEPVVTVMAATGIKAIENYGLPEDYKIVIRFKSGLLAHVWANANLSLPIHKTDLRVYTQNTSYEADNKSGILRSYNKFQTQKVWMEHRTPVNATVDDEIAIVNDFLEKRRPDHAPLPSIHEAVDVLRILDAIERSIQTKKIVNIAAHRHFSWLSR